MSTTTSVASVFTAPSVLVSNSDPGTPEDDLGSDRVRLGVHLEVRDSELGWRNLLSRLLDMLTDLAGGVRGEGLMR